MLHEDIVDIGRREVTGEQFLLIEVDHDLHVLAAVRVRQDDSRDRHEQGSDPHVGQIIELSRRQVVGADLEHGHRYRRWRETHDHWRGNVRRQRFDDVLRNAHDIRFGSGHVDAVLEKNIGDTAAVVRMTMDIFDAFDRRSEEAFEQIGDASFHLLRQQACVDPDHGGDGNRDIREDVSRHMENRLGAHEHDQDRHDDEGIGPAEGNEDDLVHRRRELRPENL